MELLTLYYVTFQQAAMPWTDALDVGSKRSGCRFGMAIGAAILTASHTKRTLTLLKKNKNKKDTVTAPFLAAKKTMKIHDEIIVNN